MFIQVKVLLVLVSAIRAQNNCGIPGQPSSFIINGTESNRTEQGAWPWIAAIALAKTDQFLCGGTIIGRKFVTSAAHCFLEKRGTKRMPPTRLIVKLGKFDISKNYERGAINSFVAEIIIHPDWKIDERYNANIAILVLEKAIRFNAFIFPICLWTSDSALTVDNGIVVGWGKSECAANRENIPRELEVTTKINEKCFLSHPHLAEFLSETTFCAGNDGMSGPCVGDGGSGLFVKTGSGPGTRYFIRGIVAGVYVTRGSCDVSVDTIYTDVLQLRNWINEVIDPKPSCGIPGQISSFIVNGTDSQQGAWPWIAAVLLAETDQFICGGTIIGPKFVVTAAHCIQDKNFNGRTEPKHPTDLIVKLGRFNLSRRYEKGAMDRLLNEIVVHPDWNPCDPKYNGDVAVLILDSPIQFNTVISPICLWTSETAPAVEKGIVVGWGKSESSELHENTPKQLEVTIKTSEDCFLSDSRLADISSKMTFCAGKDGTSGPCSGDSGSGLVINSGSGITSQYFLRGIVSAGLTLNGYCDVSADVIFTDGIKVTDWIRQVMSDDP